MYPNFENCKYFDYPQIANYSIMGFIQQFRPDVGIVDPLSINITMSTQQWQTNIDKKLEQYPIVFLFLVEGEILVLDDQEKIDLLNSYTDSPVYLITQLDSFCQQTLTYTLGITCKILELPWMVTNEVMCWHLLGKQLELENIEGPDTNFVCFIGRNEWFKTLLAESLVEKFSHNGEVYFMDHPENYKYVPKISPIPNYTKLPSMTQLPEYVNDANACSRNLISNGKATMNTLNYAKLIKFCDKVPLIIHPESTTGVFCTTEKTMWPVLAGKLQLTFGRPYNYAYLMQFIETDYSNIFDLSFDTIEAWDQDAVKEKLEIMLESNRYQIKHAPDVYQQHKNSLETDKINIVKNMYNFFVRQLNSV